MKKIFIIIIISFIGVLVACNNVDVVNEEVTTVYTTTEEVSYEYKYIGTTKAEQAAEDYILALIWCNDINDMLLYLDISDDTLIFIEDYNWYLAKRGLDWINGSKIELSSVKETGQNEKRQVKIGFSNGQFVMVDMILNAVGGWTVNTSDMFISNWQFKSQRDTKPKLDGIDISKYKVKSDSKYDMYIFPYITPRERKITQTSMFGSRTITVNVKDDKKEVFVEWNPIDTLNEELILDGEWLTKQINKTILENNWEQFKSLFVDYINMDKYKKIFDNAVVEKRKVRKYVIRDVTKSGSNDKFIIHTNNMIEIAFGVESDWQKDVVKKVSAEEEIIEQVDCSMKIKCNMQIVLDNTEWKIYSISENALNKVSDGTKEY